MERQTVVSPSQEVDESVFHRVIKAEAAGVFSDPETSLRVNEELQRIVWQGEFAVDLARVPIISRQAVHSADPDEA